ncbi:MAG TPA: glycoside hydrolase family 2 TIM barrel-domain containing protein [Verrucomicrobiae bacterium]|nr:glycoside hydrolase family 2 TIM barrel-domain containing protein [Verrucomicrobiae bacterium]
MTIFLPFYNSAKYLALLALAFLSTAHALDSSIVLPLGVEPVWDVGKAYHETTPTRERLCLNGLWRWQPAEVQAKKVPLENWGYFKVPGSWPGITDYMQKDCQVVYTHPSWAEQKLSSVTAAWYQREITVPGYWAGRVISLSVDYLNSYAIVFLDGRQIGEVRFPAGEIDLTESLKDPGAHVLTLLVVALPLKGVMLSYTDSASAREQKGSVERRGLCGDIYLMSKPPRARLTDIRVETSFRKGQVTFDAGVELLDPEPAYRLKAVLFDGKKIVRSFVSEPFRQNQLQGGRFAFASRWVADKLWDIYTPTNQYDCELTLLSKDGAVLDTSWRTRFGFREFWINGRDFFLNGTRIFLCAVPLDSAQVSAAAASYAGARETLERLKGIGINLVYTHNYGCLPGAHLGFAEILRAADDAGMLVSFSQPHFSHYEWAAADADQSNGYAAHAGYYVRAAQNHPAVVMYSMSHNATGYDEDMNPDLIDGIHEARDQWATRNVILARRAETIVHQLDPTRIVYHHASGNLGSMHVMNFYPNFVPIQELSDWFEHWSVEGIKPAFMCEYGAPFTWDWTLYRGWYKGQREFGSAAVPWEFCVAEWNAQFLGDRAYAISEAERTNLRWEAARFREGRLWHRWDYPVDVGSTQFGERYPVFAMYLKDNWRAFRTWQVSAISPWEFQHFWKLRDGTDRRRHDFKTDWQNLQRPGFSPDYEDQRYERMDLAYALSDWEPTIAARALVDNNRPLLAWIAGGPAGFTTKDHIFLPGQSVLKQLIVINNSRQTVSADCEWSFRGPGAFSGRKRFTIPTGEQKRVPIEFRLPSSAGPGQYELMASARFSNAEVQHDSVAIDIVQRPQPQPVIGRIALFDPVGETGEMLKSFGIKPDRIEAESDLSGFDVLIVGRAGLTLDGPGPNLDRVPAGLKVLMLEQTPEVLEKRLGFRVQEYGLRQVFPRISEHPALAHLGLGALQNWRGESTLVPPRLKYELRPRYGPTVQWCGLTEPRLWRCGNRGNVASVLIEKPSCGDFLPILDGGFSLQFSPLMEYREGKGIVVFCQMDVTSRTEVEPSAEILMRNLLQYLLAWTPPQRFQAVYAGEPAGKQDLESIGVRVQNYERSKLTSRNVLVIGPGAPEALASETSAISSWLKNNGRLLSIGLTGDETSAFLSSPVLTTQAEHISFWFSPPELKSIFAGIGPADLHNRDAGVFPLVSSGGQVLGDGVLAWTESGRVVCFQIPPWHFSGATSNVRRTHRRFSYALSRALANMGVEFSVPLLERFARPPEAGGKNRCLAGLYVDVPEDWDDPYRHFRW